MPLGGAAKILQHRRRRPAISASSLPGAAPGYAPSRRHRSCSTCPSERSSGPPGFECTTSVAPCTPSTGTRNAQPRSARHQRDRVRQCCCCQLTRVHRRAVALQIPRCGDAQASVSAMRTLTRDESGRSPTHGARPSPARSTHGPLKLGKLSPRDAGHETVATGAWHRQNQPAP